MRVLPNAGLASLSGCPVFNTYRPVQDPDIREPILAVARANGIQAGEVWEMDASRQTTRISANVSGMLGTERITLNDNLLNRAVEGRAGAARPPLSASRSDALPVADDAAQYAVTIRP